MSTHLEGLLLIGCTLHVVLHLFKQHIHTNTHTHGFPLIHMHPHTHTGMLASDILGTIRSRLSQSPSPSLLISKTEELSG